MWISTRTGFYSFNPATKVFSSFLESTTPGKGFPAGYIMSISEDRVKTLWVASTQGVFHIAPGGAILGLYNCRANDPKSLSYTIATSLLEDSKGHLWVSTLGGGLNLFDREKETFQPFTKKDGLTNNIVYGMLEDGNKNLWLPTNYNLSVFNTGRGTFETVSEKDGLPSSEFTQNALFENNAKEFLVGSPEGLIVFNPAAYKQDSTALPVFISSLRINYADVNYEQGSPVKLQHGDKTVTFEFACPDFRDQEKIEYAFKLEGFDNEWYSASAARRMATYTSLPFGDYVFRIRVRKGGLPWQESMQGVSIAVIPPFWLTRWFMTMEVLLGMGLVIYLVRFYAQRKLKQQLRTAEVKQRILEERERISRDLHDNVGSHLTYIISSLDNITYKKEATEIAHSELSKLSDFSRDTMQQLRESIWAINKENISLAELRDRIRDYAVKMTSVADIRFELYYEIAHNVELTPSHAINIYRIVQEAIHNAVKHSGAATLSVCMALKQGSTIYITIEDNGKGITETGSGYGLQNMQSRAREINGELIIEMAGSKGTRISLSVPLITANAL